MIKLRSATLDGFTANIVDIECSFSKGLPSFTVVGLASSAIQESKERVRSALIANGFKFPPLKITINLSPSDLQKDGSHFDLPIALCVALEEAGALSGRFDDFLFLAELGLDGALKHTNSIFPIVLSLAEDESVKNIVTSKESAAFLSKIPNITVFAADTLKDALLLFESEMTTEPEKSAGYEYPSVTIQERPYYYTKNYEADFADVKGQVVAKRAALIAAAGFHNILLEGSPGCGKSMILKRLRYILPPMEFNEILKNACLEFLDAKQPSFAPVRSFRSPHHTSTRASIFGGGSRESKVGEVALANGGMLYFDELPHFEKAVLEAMREPLEDYRVLISRVNSKVLYDAKFLFACSQNPCPCGNLLSSFKECRCTTVEVQKYKNRLSEPFLDRLDIFVQMSENEENASTTVNSHQMHEAVLRAFEVQKSRGQQELNGKLNEAETEQFCVLNPEAQTVLLQAANRFGLSLRAVAKTKKVARTIADLDASRQIQKSHLLEALSYRKR